MNNEQEILANIEKSLLNDKEFKNLFDDFSKNALEPPRLNSKTSLNGFEFSHYTFIVNKDETEKVEMFFVNSPKIDKTLCLLIASTLAIDLMESTVSEFQAFLVEKMTKQNKCEDLAEALSLIEKDIISVILDSCECSQESVEEEEYEVLITECELCSQIEKTFQEEVLIFGFIDKKETNELIKTTSVETINNVIINNESSHIECFSLLEENSIQFNLWQTELQIALAEKAPISFSSACFIMLMVFNENLGEIDFE